MDKKNILHKVDEEKENESSSNSGSSKGNEEPADQFGNLQALPVPSFKASNYLSLYNRTSQSGNSYPVRTSGQFQSN